MWEANFLHKRALKSVGDLVTCPFPRSGSMKFPRSGKRYLSGIRY